MLYWVLVRICIIFTTVDKYTMCKMLLMPKFCRRIFSDLVFGKRSGEKRCSICFVQELGTLSELFTEGAVVRCRVVDLERDERDRLVPKLSVDPRVVNRDLSMSTLRADMVRLRQRSDKPLKLSQT